MEKPHIDHLSSAFSLSQGKEHKNMHLFTPVQKEVVEKLTNTAPSNTISWRSQHLLTFEVNLHKEYLC